MPISLRVTISTPVPVSIFVRLHISYSYYIGRARLSALYYLILECVLYDISDQDFFNTQTSEDSNTITYHDMVWV
jgi:hypothetical protein